MYFCEKTIKNLKDAYAFVCHYAWEEVGESVNDVFKDFIEDGYTVHQFAYILLKAGIIDASLAAGFVGRFSGEELNIDYVGGPSKQLDFFVSGVDEEEIEKYFGLFYAAMLLFDDTFRNNFWDDYEDDIDEDDEYALEERHESTGYIVHEMPVLPIGK